MALNQVRQKGRRERAREKSGERPGPSENQAFTRTERANFTDFENSQKIDHNSYNDIFSPWRSEKQGDLYEQKKKQNWGVSCPLTCTMSKISSPYDTALFETTQ